MEVRCPIYGFVELDDWEKDIVSQPAFQRLRRIRQLAWTDVVYPGAMHTRFEHSLGVMHMATQVFRGVVQRSGDVLRREYDYDDHGLRRVERLVRFAALLHDVGHGPFSHAVESLAPDNPERKGHKYEHEDYSVAIIKAKFRDVIEGHPQNKNYGFRIEEVSGLIEGRASAGNAAIWRDVISGQLDADRMDYLLRDSYHAGVDYGRYDWRRLVNSVQLVRDPETDPDEGEFRFGVASGGRHVAEGLILARYMMFSQVYFHKVRVILDHHLHLAVEAVLPGGRLPPPTGPDLDEYLRWDDWRVLGAFASGEGGEHARRLRERDFFRMIWETSEFPADEELARFDEAKRLVEDLEPVSRDAGKSWYKSASADDLLVAEPHPGGKTELLSDCSGIVGSLKPSRRKRLYVAPDRRRVAEERLKSL